MDTFYDYRVVWTRHPWLLAYFVVVIAVLALAIIGTAAGVVPLAILFIPALAGGYVHHLMVMKRLDS